LWAQGELYRARPDYCRAGVKSGADDILTYTRQSPPSMRRSILKSRQDYEVDMDDDSVSHISLIIMYIMSLLFFIFIVFFVEVIGH